MTYSIVVPVYNVAPYLRACLDSVLSQTYSAWELICVDDGSSDGSGAILDAYSVKDRRIKVVHQRNAGVSAARNAALQMATGDWILFLDGDDVLRANALTSLAKALDVSGEADIIRFELKQFADGQVPEWPHEGFNCRKLDMSKNVELDSLRGWFVQRAYRHAAVEGLRFPLLKHGEDMVYLVQAILRARSEIVLSDALYGYRQRQGSASGVVCTPAYVSSILGYLKLLFAEVEVSKKMVSPRMIRFWCNNLTEGVIFDLLRLVRVDRKEAFVEAKRIWKSVFALRCIPPCQRLRYHLFRCCPTYVSALALFALPHWLKVTGLHR